MTTQTSEPFWYGDQKHLIDNKPLEAYFKLSGQRPPFLVTTTMCWRGYTGTWMLVDGKLWLSNLNGYIAKEPLVDIADFAFRHQIDYEDQALCRKIILEDLFPDAQYPFFAYWYSGAIDVSLSDDEPLVEKSLKLQFKNGLLISKDVVIKHALTTNEIELGLTSADVSVRRKFAKQLEDYVLTDEQIERGMLDEDGNVRMSFYMHARWKRFPFTPERLERALTAEYKNVREYVTSRFSEYKFTRFQLDRALKDESPRVRSNIAMNYGDQLTPEQIERGLKDESSLVRGSFALHCGDQLTPEQIERGLTDEDEEVRVQFVDNDDVVLSPEQIQRGLKDASLWVQLEIAARYSCELHQAPTIDPDNQTIINNLYEING